MCSSVLWRGRGIDKIVSPPRHPLDIYLYGGEHHTKQFILKGIAMFETMRRIESGSFTGVGL